ncbi:MAG: class I SAM-dependent methyltransferase [Verrucomicrobia bacterium]|nr:class I SAM-dependent methyltransferase [Verrucomicrobiota bacterium]MBU1909612.1 class I SAM-dependent methyltransferase [Verrucomicrobiota bacterium]
MKEIAHPPCEVLKEIFTTKQVLLPSGERKRTSAGIDEAHAWALYNVILKHKPKTVIEIGMAQGISTLSILCALSQTGGQLISIDPYFTWTEARDAALYSIHRAGFSSFHTHIEKASEIALPKLLADGLKIGAAYIDGDHHYDHVFIDFFYLDLMLTPGGVIGFNNAGWPDVFRVIRYLQKHHPFEELDVGLNPDYRARNPILSLFRRIMRMPRQDRYYMKSEVHTALPGSGA